MKGAAGVFIINPGQPALMARTVDLNKRSNLYYPRKNEDSLVNHAILSHAFALNMIGKNLDSLIKMARASQPFGSQYRFDKQLSTSFSYTKQRDTILASNVMGLIEGSDKKDEYVFLTAHYDHLGKQGGLIYYGADDDGSGTCAVLEMAAAFTRAKAAGYGPRRTIVFMTVSGEEKGLWGSEYYSDNPVFPLDKTSVDLNTDMVGRTDTERTTPDSLNYVYVIGHDKLSSDLPIINEGVNKKYTNLAFDYKFDDPKDENKIYFRSDHYNFARKGVPILFFYDGMLKADYHKSTDTIDKINWELYEKRVRMIFHTAWVIANRDEMLKRDIPMSGETR
jgi:Zn-dependent M28 family amino/carboxypeptidase